MPRRREQRFARSLLYTYPSPADPGSQSFLDCHWTTLNFFNATPDRQFEDINIVSATFKRDYHPITGQAALGDVLLLVNAAGTVLHSCVHVADDIVFTKNGASSSAPWILMTLADVVAYYPSDGPIDVQRYRSRSIP